MCDEGRERRAIQYAKGDPITVRYKGAGVVEEVIVIWRRDSDGQVFKSGQHNVTYNPSVEQIYKRAAKIRRGEPLD